MEADAHLPKVDEIDIGIVRLEEILDPEQYSRWKDFATEQPVLAYEILRRARFTDRGFRREPEIAQYIINTTTFAIKAIETALQRQESPPESSSS